MFFDPLWAYVGQLTIEIVLNFGTICPTVAHNSNSLSLWKTYKSYCVLWIILWNVLNLWSFNSTVFTSLRKRIKLRSMNGRTTLRIIRNFHKQSFFWICTPKHYWNSSTKCFVHKVFCMALMQKNYFLREINTAPKIIKFCVWICKIISVCVWN